MAEVHERFAKAFAAVGVIRKAQRNAHHGYAYRGIDDVMSALHGVLADNGLFYVPRCVGESYEEWQTSKGNRLQVARLSYEFEFFASDGSSLVAGPVVGQSADTDDKAPMQALSQAAKPALLHVFCIPTDDMGEGDAKSPVSSDGGREAAQQPTSKTELGGIQQAAFDIAKGLDDKAREHMREWMAEEKLPIRFGELSDEDAARVAKYAETLQETPF